MKTFFLALVPLAFILGLGAIVYEVRHVGDTPPQCALNECPTLLHIEDSQKTFTYRQSARIRISLDERTNPASHLNCVPAGILEKRADTADTQAPLYEVTLEGVAQGRCVLSDDHFSTTIIIE